MDADPQQQEQTSGAGSGGNTGNDESQPVKPRPASRCLKIAGVLVAVFLVAFVTWLFERSPEPVVTVDAPPEDRQRPVIRRPDEFPQTAGNPNAKVFVVAVLPFGQNCISKTTLCLTKLAERYPDKLFVEFPPVMFDEEHDSAYQGSAPRTMEDPLRGDANDPELFCAYVMVNGKQRFELPGRDGTGTRNVFMYWA